MPNDEFEARLARVRHRFATTLESKISNAVVSADRMTRGDNRAFECVSDSYRHLHSISGIGPTVGFTATGEAAHAAKAALIQAYLEKRRPTEGEVNSLKKGLAKLRLTAASELRLMYQRGG
jgi:HPt (histidine-containing phosphotransfer) domain-containing protein